MSVASTPSGVVHSSTDAGEILPGGAVGHGRPTRVSRKGWAVTGEGEGREREPGKADFGPPTGDFGPPLSEFGPPTGELPASGWQPEARPASSELTWRPAGASAVPPETPVVPPPPPQYRAPDSSTPAYQPAPTDSRPVTRPMPGAPDPDATVRHQVPSEPAVRPRPGGAGGDATGGPPLPRAGGLSWDSDPIAQKLTPQSVAGALAQKPSRRFSTNKIVTVAAVVVALIAVVVAVVVVRSGSDGTAPVADPGATLDCPASREGAVTVGDGAGDTDSGPGAILGFQHAFYVERSGARVREFVAPDSPAISSADTIQQAIDKQIPAGTRHCVQITERAADTFDVDLTERRPDGTTTVYKQTVTTVDRLGKTVLWMIVDRPRVS